MDSLRGKKIVVCGGSRGIGRAVVDLLLQQKAEVLMVALDQERLRDNARFFAEKFPSGKLSVCSIDLSADGSDQALAEFTAGFPQVDGLALTIGNGRPIEGSKTQRFVLSAKQNLFPGINSFYGLQPALNKSESASCVFVSSIVARELVDCPVEYAATKSSLEVYVKHWSQQYSPIRFNVVAPGNVLTDGSVWDYRKQTDPKGLESWLESAVPLGRLSTAAEIAQSIVFLLSSQSSFITGSTITVDGGQTRSFS